MKNKIKKVPKHIRDIYAKSDIERSSTRDWKPTKTTKAEVKRANDKQDSNGIAIIS